LEIRGPGRAQARENLKKLRGLVRRIQNRGYATLARTAEYLSHLSTGDESNASIDATNAVNLMTVHAAKGLEFPIVFLVNLSRGAGGPPLPIRVFADGGADNPVVAVGSFQAEADQDSRAREQEESKRLLYVALTRARDRLYLATTLKNGTFEPVRGSLGEVLPDAFAGLFAEAWERRARSPGTTGEIASPLHWSLGDHSYRFRVALRPSSPGPQSSGLGVQSPDRAAGSSEAPPRNDFGRIVDLPGPATVSVTDQLELAHPPAAASDRLVGRLVHRLFQGGVPIDGQLQSRARLLCQPDEVAGVPEREELARKAAELYGRLRARQDVQALLAEGEPFFEVPIAWVRQDESRTLLT
ncbi:MAG: 3'-5' exonuclease, partial [Acidimicrobiia bacterium]